MSTTDSGKERSKSTARNGKPLESSSRGHSNGTAKSSQPSTASESKTTSTDVKEQSSFLSNIFRIPAPIKHLFETFPLVVLPPNTLPLSTSLVHDSTPTSAHILLTWTTSSDSRIASFNPTCLAWQVFMRARKIHFTAVPSSNHAAGQRLPLLLVNNLDTDQTRNPWQKSKVQEKTPFKELGPRDLEAWAADADDGWPRELEGVYAAYKSLVDNELRRAWLYHMNMTANFDQITTKAYIHTQSQSSFVRIISAYELRAAAKAELQKFSPALDSNGCYQDAIRAFSALENLLRRRRAFGEARGTNGSNLPTFLEASLFSYLFLLLEFPFEKWADNRLVETLLKFPELVKEEKRMKEEVFGGIERPEIYDRILEHLQ